MLLYHLSDGRYETLEPQIGESRHDGEDPDAVDRPVVYLSASSNSTSTPPKKYMHVVDVPEDDPDLRIDRNLQSLVNSAPDDWFDGSERPVWYHLHREVEVIEIREWNEEERSYFTIWERG